MLKHGRRLLGKSHHAASVTQTAAGCTITALAQTAPALPPLLPAFLVPAWTSWDDPHPAGKISGKHHKRSHRATAISCRLVPDAHTSRRSYTTSTTGRSQQAARHAEQSQHPLASAFLRDFVLEHAQVALQEQEQHPVASTSRACPSYDSGAHSSIPHASLSRPGEQSPQETLNPAVYSVGREAKGKGRAEDQGDIAVSLSNAGEAGTDGHDAALVALRPDGKAETERRRQVFAETLDALCALAVQPMTQVVSDSPTKNHLPRALLSSHIEGICTAAERDSPDAQAVARGRLWRIVVGATDILSGMVVQLGECRTHAHNERPLHTLVEALARALIIEPVKAEAVLAFCLAQASAAGTDGQQEIRRRVEKVVLLQYWLAVCQPRESHPPGVSLPAQNSRTSPELGAQDRKALFQFLRNFFTGSESHPGWLSALPGYLALHAHARTVMSTARLPGFNLLETCTDLSSRIVNARQAKQLLAFLISRQAVAYARYQNDRDVREYDSVLINIWRTRLSSHLAALSPREVERMSRTALSLGLAQTAALLFMQVVPGQQPPIGAPSGGLESDGGYPLALLASRIAAACLNAGSEAGASLVLKTLEGLAMPRRGDRAGPWRSLWQRRLQAIFRQGEGSPGAPSLIADIDALLAEMSESGVPIDDYFVASLYRGIAASTLPLTTAVELFHGVVHSLAQYSATTLDSDTCRLAVAQSDLALFERAAVENAQLPWTPLVEQDRLLLKLNLPSLPSSSSALSVPDGARLKAVSHRLTIMATILRHSLLRHNWSQALQAYEGVLEIYRGEVAANAGRPVDMRLQRILQGCFIRTLVGLLNARRLEDTAHVMRLTLKYLGAHHISSRAVSRVLLAACSPRYHAGVRTVTASEGRKGRAPAAMTDIVHWDILSRFLGIARDWAEERYNRPLTRDGVSFDVDAGSRPRRALREVFSFWNHADALASAVLQALFLPAREARTKGRSDRVRPKDGFQQVLDTLLALGADVDYRRFWQRVCRAADSLNLAERTPVDGEWSWRAVSPALWGMCADADDRRRKEAMRYLAAKGSEHIADADE